MIGSWQVRACSSDGAKSPARQRLSQHDHAGLERCTGALQSTPPAVCAGRPVPVHRCVGRQKPANWCSEVDAPPARSARGASAVAAGRECDRGLLVEEAGHSARIRPESTGEWGDGWKALWFALGPCCWHWAAIPSSKVPRAWRNVGARPSSPGCLPGRVSALRCRNSRSLARSGSATSRWRWATRSGSNIVDIGWPDGRGRARQRRCSGRSRAVRPLCWRLLAMRSPPDAPQAASTACSRAQRRAACCSRASWSCITRS